MPEGQEGLTFYLIRFIINTLFKICSGGLRLLGLFFLLRIISKVKMIFIFIGHPCFLCRCPLDGFKYSTLQQEVNMEYSTSYNVLFCATCTLYNVRLLGYNNREEVEMLVSQAKKESNAKWDKDNMSYQTVKVKRETLISFKKAVADRGDKVNTVLREVMERYIEGITASGGLELPPETMTQAQNAAQAAGETLQEFIARAIKDTADRDAVVRKMAKK